MDALGAVVGDVVSEQTPQMLLVEHNDVIQQLSANAAHPPLRRAILPWTSIRGPSGRHLKPFDRFRHSVREDNVVRLSRARIARGILHDVPASYETDFVRAPRVSSAVARITKWRGKLSNRAPHRY